MVDLPSLILQLRPDLRKLGFDLGEQREKFLAWVVTAGVNEYKAIAEDPKFAELMKAGSRGSEDLTPLQQLVRQARPDVRAAFPIPPDRERFLVWFYTHGVEECGFWPWLPEAEQRGLLGLSEPWGSRLCATVAKRFPPPEPRVPIGQRPFGVNLIGYAFGQLGIGEDARMAGRALLEAGVPMTMLNFPPGADIPQNDRSMADHVTERGDYAFNIFCMTAEENGRFFAERGRAQFRDRYNIGYWPWELGRWPRAWEAMLDLVDEVWVSTRHTGSALQPVCSKPLQVMPMAVQLGPITPFASRVAARRHFGLDPRARLFCFAFDLNSYVARKNPQACVDAFLAAFPADEFSAADVGLVIKVHRPARRNRAWEALKRLAEEDARIRIIEGTLSRPDLLALYQACDCFVSLHRAEGFGRGIAETLQLGLHVICTGYSGNVDFCRAPHADLVRHRLVRVERSEYPHAQGQQWAEPDVDHAAQLMQDFVQRPRRRSRGATWPEFSTAAVGQRYRARLEAIQCDVIAAGNKLAWAET